VVVISSGIEKVYEELLSLPTQTNPALRVNVGESLLKRTLNEIFAFEDVLERGTYPIFLARETTFSRKVADSKKDSFAIIFALNELTYVLYAKTSINTEKLDPSKSKSVKLLFDLK
jgi:hypothetical protein